MKFLFEKGGKLGEKTAGTGEKPGVGVIFACPVFFRP